MLYDYHEERFKRTEDRHERRTAEGIVQQISELSVQIQRLCQ
jgi:hypothetical protein